MNQLPPLAKPSGISLEDHTRHVVEQAGYILKAWPFLENKFRLLTDQELHPLLLEAAEWHDQGKQHPQWQQACRNDYQEYQEWRRQNGLDPEIVDADDHRRYEQEMRRIEKIPGKHLINAKLRHEFASLKAADQKGVTLSPEIRASIAAHHGRLAQRDQMRWQHDGIQPGQEKGPFAPLWEEFRRLSHRETLTLQNRSRIINRFKFTAVRALLQLADTRASRLESEGNQALVELEPFKLKHHFEQLRPVQQAAVEMAGEFPGILRAPTGSGKTYAALLWAEQQVRAGRADRLVVAMPTRFTSNALAISVTDQMGETGLYHSSAWHNYYRTTSADRSINREKLRMAKYLAAPVTVCTIDHLLISLTGAREPHHSSFYFLANSAVVFDEADFYDPFVQANLVVLLDVLRILAVPVLIMSATVPDSARRLYQINLPIQAPVSDPQENRSTKILQWAGAAAEPEELAPFLQDMLQRGTGIVYANTVARALAYYQFLSQNQPPDPVPLVVYHSRFTEPDKKAIEEKLIKMLGKEAWLNEDQPPRGIAILTQIGEMSVNISAPLMLSDACPWDRLTQRLGRLVRFGECQEGTCYLVEPRKNGQFYPAPYGEYNQSQKGWIPFQAMISTLGELRQIPGDGLIITPELLVEKVNQLFPEPPVFSGSASTNQRNFKNKIRDNWLILPNSRSDEFDETRVDNDWSSRQIPPQTTVFICTQPRFNNYDELYEFTLEYGVSCPVSQVEKELRKGENSRITLVRNISLGDKDQSVSLYYTQDYSKELGLAFLFGFPGGNASTNFD